MSLPKITNTRTHRIDITFHDSDTNQNQTSRYTILTPPDITDTKAAEKLNQLHNELINKQTEMETVYDQEGMSADTLLWYACRKFGWEYKEQKPDIALYLEI